MDQPTQHVGTRARWIAATPAAIRLPQPDFFREVGLDGPFWGL